MATKGIKAENGALHLESSNTPKLNNLPAFLKSRGVTLEQIKVEPLKVTMPISSEFMDLVNTCLRFSISTVYPDESKLEPLEESGFIRIGNYAVNYRVMNNSVLLLTVSRFNNNFRAPVFYRGSWTLNPVRALALARQMINALRKRNFTYKVDDNLLLMNEAGKMKVLDINRSYTDELTNEERMLLKSALEAFILSGGAGNFAGRMLGKIKVLNADSYRIGHSMVKVTVDKAFVLKEIL